MRMSLDTLRKMPNAVTEAARSKGGVDIVDENGDQVFHLSIPSEPLADYESRAFKAGGRLTATLDECIRLRSALCTALAHWADCRPVMPAEEIAEFRRLSGMVES